MRNYLYELLSLRGHYSYGRLSLCVIISMNNYPGVQLHNCSGVQLSHGSPASFLNSSSSIIRTPSFLALSSLLPASSGKHIVRVLDTLLETLPPRLSMISFASFRVKVGRVPVSTNIRPASSLLAGSAFSCLPC